MRWLLDMNIPRRLKLLLESAGHQCRHAGDIGLERADDWAIMEEAARRDEVILTHDLDYGRLLTFTGATKPSVVIIRLSRLHAQAIYERLLRVWPLIEQPLADGAIVVLEDAAIRVRPLPLERKSP